MPLLLLLNTLFFALLIVFNDTSLSSYSHLRILHSFVELIVILVLPSLNLVFFFHLFIKRIRSLFEYLVLASIFGLIIPPLTLTLEHTALGWLFHALPLWNSFAIFVFLVAISLYSKKHLLFEKRIIALPFNRSEIKHFFSEKMFFFSSIYFLLTAFVFTISYYALPDLDPYYWLEKYRGEFTSGTLTQLSGYRPLFASLAYIFTISADIDSYAFFKYVLPLLPITLVFPITLLAHGLKHPLERLLVILSVFVNAVSLTYLELPVPQSLSIIFSFYAVYFLIFSFETGNKLYYWLSGSVLFLGYFYHEMMIIPFLLWGFISLVYYRRFVFSKIQQRWISALLVAALIFPYLQQPFLFVSINLKKIFSSLLQLEPNWLFPSRYVNVDGNPMGWGDFLGVTKYYLYYAGPEFFFLALILLYLFLKKDFRLKTITSNVELATAAFIFIVFFSIAEILPRLFSIALLPERSWILAGIFSLPFLFVVFRSTLPYKNMVYWILILGFSANAAGAAYINNSKKYLITEGQMKSAQWINSSLPDDRIIYTFENGRLLQFYSGSKIHNVKDPNFYYDENIFEEEFNENQSRREKAFDDAEREITNTRKQLKVLEDLPVKNTGKSILLTLNEQITSLKRAVSALEFASKPLPKSGHFFIYYAAPDPRNPYLNRPYYSKFIGQEEKIFFDNYPEKFKRIYSDETNKIFIWQVL